MKNHVSKRLRMLVAAVGAVLLGTLFLSPAATAGTERTPRPTTWRVHVGDQSRNGAIQGMQFLPGDIWIDVGDRTTIAASHLVRDRGGMRCAAPAGVRAHVRSARCAGHS